MDSKNQPTNSSLSTMWAIKNYPDLNVFFATARDLGFQKVELNHQVNSAMLSQVIFDHIQFSSVHEPCPADISTRDLVDRDWLISSIDEPSRKRGVETVRRSIKLAHQLGAPIVVTHCGDIPTNLNDEGKLRSLFKQGKENTAQFLEIKEQFIQARAALAAPRLEAVKKSLHELLEYAGQLNVRLGLENRYHYFDIPSIDEMGELLDLAEPSQLGFIYDVGHAQAMDRMGFYAHADWLTRYSSRMFGCHLHDVLGLTDHLAPGQGEINFKSIAKYLPEGSFKTCELTPGNTLAQVKHGLNVLVEAGCVKYL